MQTDLQSLRELADEEIAQYEYPSLGNSTGVPWTDERVGVELREMKAAVVSPYWADVELRETWEDIHAEPAIVRKCAVVADDGKGSLVVFDPLDGDLFLLVVRNGSTLVSIGVRGDLVGCFFAR